MPKHDGKTKDDKSKQGKDTLDNKSPALFNDKDVSDVKDFIVDAFVDKQKEKETLNEKFDTKAKEEQFKKDIKKKKKDIVKKKKGTKPPPPGGGAVKTKTGTIMSLVTKPEATVTETTTVQLKVTGVSSGVTQIISVVLSP